MGVRDLERLPLRLTGVRDLERRFTGVLDLERDLRFTGVLERDPLRRRRGDRDLE